MKLDDKLKRHNELYAMIAKRNKLLDEAKILQEKIDRAKGNNGKPQKTYESKDYLDYTGRY